MQKSNGMYYAPVSDAKAAVAGPGEFPLSVIGLDHGHIYAMAQGLIEAGATPCQVFDPDTEKAEAFCKAFPGFRIARSREEVLYDRSILVASAIRPDLRCALGLEVMTHGKDYFSDKPGFLSLEDAARVEKACDSTKRKYMIYFGERIHVEGAVMAQQLIDGGDLGDLVNIQILAPHRLSRDIRPSWFWNPEQNGGILADLGSHQMEQMLSFAHADTGTILSSAVGNYTNHDHPDFQDCGQVSFVSDTGVMGFCKVDWFTPDGMGAWGDGRVFITGTKATLELRKYLDVARSNEGDQIYFTDSRGEHQFCAHGQTGFPFFGQFIRDCLDRTDNAMTQKHVIESMRLAIEAQERANRIEPKKKD
jgi:predicted dehydrogenase